MALYTTPGGHNSDSYITLTEANAYIASRPDSTNWANIDYLERERVLRQATIDLDILRFRGNILLTSAGGQYYAPQKLQFPRTINEYYTGYATGGSTTTLVDTIFEYYRRPDDYYVNGSIIITDGTNVGEIRDISGYVHSTYTFTVSSAFTSAIDTTSKYIIMTPIPDYIKWAQCEQALYLTNHIETTSKYNEWKASGIEEVSIGDVSVRFSDGGSQFIDKVGGILSVSAFKYIRKYLDLNRGMGRA